MKNISIATYSAHGTVLKNLVESMGDAKLNYLCVNCGGFKCPRNCIDLFEDDISLFKNSVAVTKSTLHAKVTLIEDDKSNKLWLWTGNMCKTTLQDGNVLLDLPVDRESANRVRHWFERLAKSKGAEAYHLIYDEKVGVPNPKKQNMWAFISQSMRNALKNKKQRKDSLHVYAYAPWGSRRFVEEICSINELEGAKFHLYTRNVPPQMLCWLDGGEQSIERFVSEEKNFLHYKMIFVTKQTAKGNHLLWTYIGSANFTESALFNVEKNGKPQNIEHAAFFYGDNKEIKNLFENFRKKKWKRRFFKKGLKEDYLKEDREQELYDYGGFMLCEIARKLAFLYDNKACQQELDRCYKTQSLLDESSKLTIWNFKYKQKSFNFFFTGSIDFAYHLRVQLNPGEDWFDLDIPRFLESYCPISPKNLNTKFEALLKIAGEKNIKGGLHNDIKKTESLEIVKRLNVRFPVDRLINKPKDVERLKKTFQKLGKMKDSFNDEQMKLYSIWSKILENL